MSPMEIGQAHPIRKSKKQKTAFREAVRAFALEQEYEYREECGSFGSKNVIMGNPDTAEYLVTAHYDTCAGMLLPNLITPCNLLSYILYQLVMMVWLLLVPAIPAVIIACAIGSSDIAALVWYILLWVNILMMMFGPANKHNANDNTSGVVTVLELMRSFPENQRDKVCFVLFDLEEAGLIGSASFRKAHKKSSENQLVLNLDCVGDGDFIMMFPTAKLKKDADRMQQLKGICVELEDKEIQLREKGFSVYPSDQKHFPLGVGICALHNGPMGLYLSRIHTSRDTVLDETNVNILRSALTSLITCAANKKG